MKPADLGGTNARDPGVKSIIHQLFRLSAILHHVVDRFEQRFQFVLAKYVCDVKPLINNAFIYLGIETGHNSEIVTGATHAPPQIRRGSFRHRDRTAIGQNHIHGE